MCTYIFHVGKPQACHLLLPSFSLFSLLLAYICPRCETCPRCEHAKLFLHANVKLRAQSIWLEDFRGYRFCLRAVLWLPPRPVQLSAPNESARKQQKTLTTTARRRSWTSRFLACMSRKRLSTRNGLVRNVCRGRCGKVALSAAVAVAKMAIQLCARSISYQVLMLTRPHLSQKVTVPLGFLRRLAWSSGDPERA